MALAQSDRDGSTADAADTSETGDTAAADDDEAEQDGSEEDEESTFGAAVQAISDMPELVDEARENATTRLNRFVYQIDDFFGAGVSVEDENQSYARIRLDARQPLDDDFKLKGTIKLRLVLPRSEERFRLLLSSEDDDDNSLEEPDAVGEVDGDRQQNLSLALRFIRTARENGSLNFDLGARMRDDSPQVFFRVNSSYKDDIGEKWQWRIVDNLYFYSKSGYENKIGIDFRRPLSRDESVFFNSATGFEWQEGRKGARIGETLGIYVNPSERVFLAFEALASYTTSLNDDQSERFGGSEIRFRIRHNVWRPWFFYEFWPSVGWPSSNGYERTYGALFRVEVEVGDG